jgi:hypothetical protein
MVDMDRPDQQSAGLCQALEHRRPVGQSSSQTVEGAGAWASE